MQDGLDRRLIPVTTDVVTPIDFDELLSNPALIWANRPRPMWRLHPFSGSGSVPR